MSLRPHGVAVAAGVKIRPSGEQEYDAFYRRFARTMCWEASSADRDMYGAVIDRDRSIVGVAGAEIVATAAMAERELSVPGSSIPAAAVMMVTVAPTHRRRGVLTAMMSEQFQGWKENARDAVAILCAAEGAIYGRFGYGLATRRAVLTGDTERIAILRSPKDEAYTVREATAAEAQTEIGCMYDQVRRVRVGWLNRSNGSWASRFYDPEHHRQGMTSQRTVVCESTTGNIVGYALYWLKARQSVTPEFDLVMLELVAADPSAYRETWRFLVELDLVRSVRLDVASPDEPLQYAVADPRAVRLNTADGVWLRVVDVRRALEARRYSRPVDVVVRIRDSVCPWNDGDWRLCGDESGARCEPARSRVDLEMGAAELGAAYLGGVPLVLLAAAGRVYEATPGALRRASDAFRWDPVAFCPEMF